MTPSAPTEQPGAGASGGVGDAWVAVGPAPLDAEAALAFVARPDCGATVVFLGTVRDHAPGRPGVEWLEYEVPVELALPRLEAVAAGARRRWPVLGPLALLHRSGVLAVGEVSVVVAATAPHRDEAFAAARWCIDTLKATVPIWKRERWAGGTDWGTCDHPLVDVDDEAGRR